MKKFLLVALAALFVGSANAQFAKKQTLSKAPAKAQHRVMPQATAKKFEMLPAKQVKPVLDKTARKLQVTQSLKNSLNPVVKPINRAARAAIVQSVYEGFGTDINPEEGGPVEWNMHTGTDQAGTKLLVQDVIPDPFGFEDGVVVEYTQSGNNIVIAPQLVASNSAGTMFVYLLDASSADGSITLTMDNNGNIIGTYDILYGAYDKEVTDMNDMDSYLGYYSYIQNIKYNVPGEIVTPTVSFEPGNLVLFAGLGLSGYSYNNNLAITSAYAPVSFRNLTTDKATEWQWSATRTSVDDVEETLTSSEKDFVINTIGLDIYHNISLKGINQTATSELFTFGVGKAEDPYTDSYVYAGGTQYQFEFSDGTYAPMTRQDPDGDLTFYTNWGTPDKYSTSMSKIYCYHEKPATPLYIEGITLPVVGGNFQSNFNLHIKIYEVDYTGSRPIFGRILAEGDATIANVDDTYATKSGLAAINFDELYTEDEFGMSEDFDGFIDTEFMIVIEGWDNGTFSAVLGCQDAPLDNARKSTWFEKTGEAGSMYSYTSWNTSLYVGLIGATYGWMHTEDNTNVTIPVEGGEATIHIADALYPAEYTWLDDEMPEWLEIGLLTGETDFDFDFVFHADALPAGEESREAEITFVQWGAKLTVKVTQGASTGINVVTTSVKTTGNAMFNLAGQRVDNSFKGLVIKDGKKVMMK